MPPRPNSPIGAAARVTDDHSHSTEGAQDRIPHSVLDTRGLPDKQALALWQEHKGLYYDLRTYREGEQTPDIRVDMWNLGNSLLGVFKVPTQTWSRSRACIGRDGMDSFMIQILRKGWNTPRNGGVTAQPGDIVVYDMAQPQDRSGGENEALTLFLPRNLLGPHLTAPDDHGEQHLPTVNPLAVLLRDHLISLSSRLPEMSLTQARAIIPATVQLAAAAMNGTVREAQAGAVRMAMIERICAYIDARILAPELSPESIAAHFGMTRRNLGYLLEPYGGVAAYIRRKRLSLIHTALMNPMRKGQPIEDIVEAYGFNHYRSFALAYQKQFRMTPREARAQALKGAALTSETDGNLEPWAYWVKGLR